MVAFWKGHPRPVSGKSRLVKYYNLARIIYMVDVVYVVYVVYLENLNNYNVIDSMNVCLKNLSITLRNFGMSAGVSSCHLF